MKLEQESALLPTPWATFTLRGLIDDSGKEHALLYLGELSSPEPLPLRIHSECLTGDALFSMRCDCGPQLQSALEKIAELGRGALIYLRQEGRGIGLVNKIRAYALQDKGMDTVEANEQLGFAADQREYHLAVAMLQELGISSVELMTNNPRKVAALEKVGIKVSKRIPVVVGDNPHNAEYLATKKGKLGHLR